MEPDDKITLDLGKDTFTINLSDTYGATTSYWSGDNTSYTLSGSSDVLTVSSTDIGNISWTFDDTRIDPDEVSKMCKEYPALDKVWRNFKSVYDMVKQDYEGKKKAGELDDEHPF